MMMIVYEWAIPFGASEKPRIGLSFITLKSTIKGRYTLPERTSRKDKHVFLRHQQTAATYFEYEILFARFLVLLASRHRPPAFTAFVLEQVQRRNFAVGAQQPQRAFLGVLRRLRNAIQIQRYWACTRHIVKHHTLILIRSPDLVLFTVSCDKPKFHLDFHVTSRQAQQSRACRASRAHISTCPLPIIVIFLGKLPI